MATQRRRLLLIAGQLGLGGAERQLYYLATGLNPDSYEVLVVSLNPDQNDYWRMPLLEAGIDVTLIPRVNRLRRVRMIRQIVADWEPDIIQVAHFFANGYGTLARWPSKKPLVGSVRFLPTRARLKQVPFFPWRYMCLHHVDALVCNSQAAAEMLKADHDRLPAILVIPNAVPAPSEEERIRLRQETRTELQSYGGSLWLGYVGWLNENKHVSLLLDAVAELLPLYPTLRVALVGDGPLRGRLEAQSAALALNDVVHFLGPRPAAERLMPAFDILCLPSKSEGMPNVLMEAGAAGVPVVAADVGGVAEVVRDGVTGLLFPSGDLTALARHLQTLLSDPEGRQLMGQAARRHISRHFSMAVLTARYEQLYAELLS